MDVWQNQQPEYVSLLESQGQLVPAIEVVIDRSKELYASLPDKLKHWQKLEFVREEWKLPEPPPAEQPEEEQPIPD